MVASNLVVLAYTFNTGYYHHWPWVVAAVSSLSVILYSLLR